MSCGKTRVSARCTDLRHVFVDVLLGAFASHEVNQLTFFALRRLVGAVGVLTSVPDHRSFMWLNPAVAASAAAFLVSRFTAAVACPRARLTA